MPEELDDDVYRQVKVLSEQGEALAKLSKFHQAIEKYIEALDLLPEPIERWGASTWLLAAIGDANFKLKEFQYAKDALSDAMHCPDAIGNPFLHLRLGQVQFELGNTGRATDELIRAYMGGGSEIFEDEDSKYFEFLRTRIKPPANGQW